jgi:hypothetical protein
MEGAGCRPASAERALKAASCCAPLSLKALQVGVLSCTVKEVTMLLTWL